MHFALWFQILAILCSCAVSGYLIYSGGLIYRQLASIGEPLPNNGCYLFAGGVLLLAFSLWRLLRGIKSLKSFRTQYYAHIEAARRA